MTEARNVWVIGAGYMGSVATTFWRNLGYHVTIFDIEKRDKLAGELNVDSISLGVQGCPNVNKASLRKLVDFSRLLDPADVWSISTPTDTHEAYARLAGECGVPKVLLEKASTLSSYASRRLMTDFPEMLIQVNYLDRAQPVVQAVIKKMQGGSFVPHSWFFWRAHDMRARIASGKEPEDQKWITLRDLCHDLSEIDMIRAQVFDAPFLNDPPSITKAQLTSWRSRQGDNFPFEGDCVSKFSMSFSDGSYATIYGEKDGPLRRYFVTMDETREHAVFAHTLPRPQEGILPFAALFSGNPAVEWLWNAALNGLPMEDATLRPLLESHGATLLDAEERPYIAAELMIKNLHAAKKNEDLICPLVDAIAIEEAVENVYSRAGWKLPLR